MPAMRLSCPCCKQDAVLNFKQAPLESDIQALVDTTALETYTFKAAGKCPACNREIKAQLSVVGGMK